MSTVPRRVQVVAQSDTAPLTCSRVVDETGKETCGRVDKAEEEYLLAATDLDDDAGMLTETGTVIVVADVTGSVIVVFVSLTTEVFAVCVVYTIVLVFTVFETVVVVEADTIDERVTVEVSSHSSVTPTVVPLPTVVLVVLEG